MKAAVIARGVAILTGATTISPLGAHLVMMFSSKIATMLTLQYLSQLTAIGLIAWALPAAPKIFAAASIGFAPWLPYFGTEAGPWACLLALPTLVVLVIFAIYRCIRTRQRLVDVVYTSLPILMMLYVFTAPFVRGQP
jgi:hypothetical protein